MLLYVFTPALELIGTIETISSLFWHRKHSEAGTFKLSMDWTKEAWDLLKAENLIYKGGKEIAYIGKTGKRTNEKGQKVIEVNGYMAEKYFDRRIIWESKTLEDTAEHMIRGLVESECIRSGRTERNIGNLVLGEIKNYPERTTRQIEHDNLETVIKSISKETGIGYYVFADLEHKKLILELYAGIDRTIEQSDRAPCIFSEEMENITDQDYTLSRMDEKTFVMVEGEETIIEYGAGAGLDRKETYYRSSSGKENREGEETVVLSDEEYKEVLTKEGMGELEKNKKLESMEASVNRKYTPDYKTAFDLGDLVTCVDRETGVILNTRITEVEEVFDETGEEIRLTFGDALPTIAEKIRKEVGK